MKKGVSGVYRILNTINFKSYIGYSTGINYRWKNHKKLLRDNTHKNKHLQSAWNKYGESMFHFSIIEELPNTLLKKEYEIIETKWVIHFDSVNKGYNQTLPGVYKKSEIPINRKEKLNKVICICKETKEVKEFDNPTKASIETGIKRNRIMDSCLYWSKGNKKAGRRSVNGFIFMKSDIYKDSPSLL